MGILVLGGIVMEFVRKWRTDVTLGNVITNTVIPIFLVLLMILAFPQMVLICEQGNVVGEALVTPAAALTAVFKNRLENI